MPRCQRITVRYHGRVVSKALVAAYAVDETGRPEVIGLDIGEVESRSFWAEFLRSLKKRRLVGSAWPSQITAKGLKHAIARVLACPCQRCTVHFVKDVLAQCRRDQRDLVSALRGSVSATDQAHARERLGHVLERLAPVAPKVCQLLGKPKRISSPSC